MQIPWPGCQEALPRAQSRRHATLGGSRLARAEIDRASSPSAAIARLEEIAARATSLPASSLEVYQSTTLVADHSGAAFAPQRDLRATSAAAADELVLVLAPGPAPRPRQPVRQPRTRQPCDEALRLFNNCWCSLRCLSQLSRRSPPFCATTAAKLAILRQGPASLATWPRLGPPKAACEAGRLFNSCSWLSTRHPRGRSLALRPQYALVGRSAHEDRLDLVLAPEPGLRVQLNDAWSNDAPEVVAGIAEELPGLGHAILKLAPTAPTGCARTDHPSRPASPRARSGPGIVQTTTTTTTTARVNHAGPRGKI